MTRKPFLPLVLYAVLAIVLLWRLILGDTYYPTELLGSFPLFYNGEITGKNFQDLDSMAILAPTETFFSSELKQGRFPLWNPYNFLGHPIYASGTSTFFYPVRILLDLLLPVQRAHDTSLFLHLWGSGLAAYFFFRVLGLSRPPSLIGGCLWMLSGFHVGFLALEASVPYGVWTPLSLALFYRAFGPGQRLELASVAGLVCALAGTSSGLNAWATLMILNGLWCLCLLATQKRLKAWILAACAMVIACLCLGMVILPVLEMAKLSQRPNLPLEFQRAIYWQFSLWLPILMVVPELLGNPAQGLHVSHLTAGGNWFFQETFLYLGLLPLFAAPFAWRYRERLAPKFFAGLVLVSILTMTTPLLGVVRMIPGFSQVSMTRNFYFTGFAMVVLATYGLESLLRSKRFMARLKWVFGAASLLLALGLLLYSQEQRSHASQAVQQAIVAKRLQVPLVEHFSSQREFVETATKRYRDHYSWPSAGLLWPVFVLATLCLIAVLWPRLSPKHRFLALLILACGDPLFYGWRLVQAGDPGLFFPNRPEISFLQSREGNAFYRLSSPAIRPNMLLPYRIAQLEGYQSLFPLRTALFAEKLQPDGAPWREIQIFPLTESASPLLDLVGIKYLLRYRGGEPPKSPRMKPVFAYNLEVLENPDSLPLAWLVPKVSGQETMRDVAEKLGHDDPRSLALVEGHPPNTVGDIRGEIRIEKRWPGGAEISVNNSQSAWLVYNEQYYPGWRAEAAGKELRIYPANLVQMAVHLDPGPQLLTLRFQPQKLRAGWMLVGLGLLLAAIAWIVAQRGEDPKN